MPSYPHNTVLPLPHKLTAGHQIEHTYTCPNTSAGGNLSNTIVKKKIGKGGLYFRTLPSYILT